MFCHKCGAQIAEGVAFCHKCGTRAVHADTSQHPMDTPEPIAESQQASITGPEPTIAEEQFPMIKAHVMSLGKKDVKWYVDFAETEVEKKGKDGKKVMRVPTYIEIRNEFARQYFPDLAPKGTTKKTNAMKETLAELKAFLEEE